MSDQNMPPPPPPPPPSGADYGAFQDPFAQGASGASLDQGKPAVAAAPSRVFIVMGLALVVVVIVFFNLFIFESEPEPVVSNQKVEIATNRVADPVPDIQPDFVPPAPSIPAPPLLPDPQLPQLNPEDSGPTNELRQQRLRSSMLVVSGGGGGLFSGSDTPPQEASDDPNLQFAGRAYRANTKAEKAIATHIGDLRSVIAQGRIIQASLETAINTQLPGSIRAIVSRDIYPEAGDQVMIPKGSRLIGQYNSSVFAGQTRVYVVWTRVIRPDGIDVAINSPLIDQIGQAGASGHVDTKFGEIFSRALLTSSISIAVAAVVDKGLDGEKTTRTTNTDGSNTSNTDLTTEASIQAVQQFGGTMAAFLRRFIDVQPTILVDRGSAVNVFVNRDLIFPPDLVGTRFIP